jgi:hypothetical protein
LHRGEVSACFKAELWAPCIDRTPARFAVEGGNVPVSDILLIVALALAFAMALGEWLVTRRARSDDDIHP